jgi:hypothetical protein
MGWLFGAGASAAGGVPTAGQLLNDFKATLYASECQLDRDQVPMADPLIADRVHRFFDDAHGLPPLNDPHEYAVAFERVYPDAAVRRKWLDTWIDGGHPSYGHRVVAVLLATGLIRWIATTNFDDLIERGYQQLRAEHGSYPSETVGALDNPDRATRAMSEDDWPLVIKLHGDIRSERLMNTSAELQAQDRTLRRALLDASRRFGLAVIGYSGRDASVMETLTKAVDEEGSFPHGLYWLTTTPDEVLPAARQLIERANTRGISAGFVEAENFDEAFGVIARHADLSIELKEYVAAARPKPRVTPVLLRSAEAGRFPALRLNALPIIETPLEALAIRCSTDVPSPLTHLLREAKMPGFGVSSGRDVLGFGVPRHWLAALAEYGPSAVEIIRLEPGIDQPASNVHGLLYEALARALARDRPLRFRLRRRGHHLVLSPPEGEPLPPDLLSLKQAYGGQLTGSFKGRRWSEGVRLRLEWQHDRLWLVFAPWTFVDRPDPVNADPEELARGFHPDPAAAWVRERWFTRRNNVWAAALAAWADILVGDTQVSLHALNLDDPSAVNASFTVARQTAYSYPTALERQR